MKYCPNCSSPVEDAIPPGDDRPRKVCPACGAVHYQNPLAVVGCIVQRPGELLLCRRAIEPAHGRWTVPAGFLELGEGARDGARRETWEEACARVEVLAPQSFLDLPHIGQTYSLYRARLLSPEFGVGSESLETRFVPYGEIPWHELAFPVIHYALRLLLEDLSEGVDCLHLGVLRFSGEGSRFEAANYDLEDHQRIVLAGD